DVLAAIAGAPAVDQTEHAILRQGSGLEAHDEGRRTGSALAHRGRLLLRDEHDLGAVDDQRIIGVLPVRERVPAEQRAALPQGRALLLDRIPLAAKIGMRPEGLLAALQIEQRDLRKILLDEPLAMLEHRLALLELDRVALAAD